MVDINKLRVGDKIKIVDKWNAYSGENPDGYMDKYLEQILTVKEVRNGFVRCVEDQEEFVNGWCWYPSAIEAIVNDTYSDSFEAASEQDLLDLIQS